MASSLAVEQNLAKFKPALFPDHPLGRGKRATGKAFAAAIGMAEGNPIGRAIESNFLRAGMSAGAVRAYVDAPVRIRLFHLFHQFQQGAAWRILFPVVMYF